MEYIAYLHKDRGSDFGVSFPDFPGCVTAGRTLQEARRMAVEALALHVAGMIADGEAIPRPSTLDALADDPDRKDAVACLVPVEAEKEKTVRINITARAKQVRQIDALAVRAGMTRSAYLVHSALSYSAARRKGMEGGRRPANRTARPAKVTASKRGASRTGG